MQIHYRNDVRGSGVDARALKSTLRSLLKAVGEDDASISITLVGDDAIRELNKAHREKDKPTDVLSFPFHASHEGGPKILGGEPERMLGDIVISVQTAARQAEDYDAPLQSEIYRLAIHGLLHVLGHDHMEPQERAIMEAEERRLAAAIGMSWPYDGDQ